MTTLDEAVALAVGQRSRGGVHLAGRRYRSGLVGQRGTAAAPVSAEPVLAFVTYGKVKLANLRARPLAVTFRDGWLWATVEGRAELAGPDDPQPG